MNLEIYIFIYSDSKSPTFLLHHIKTRFCICIETHIYKLTCLFDYSEISIETSSKTVKYERLYTNNKSTAIF